MAGTLVVSRYLVSVVAQSEHSFVSPVHLVHVSLIVGWVQFRAKVALAELGIGNTEKGSYLIAQLLSRYPNYPEMLLAGAAVSARRTSGEWRALFFCVMLFSPVGVLEHFLNVDISCVNQEDIDVRGIWKYYETLVHASIAAPSTSNISYAVSSIFYVSIPCVRAA